MDGQEVVCEACEGRRFTPEVLAYTVDGLSIADVDALSVDQARRRLSDTAVDRALRHLSQAGLGYLRLGQSLTTLSGGECQRLKIAKELRDAERPTTYVLDEPTTGLHMSDIDGLLRVLDALVDRGHTVVVIEHNLDVVRQADWLIDPARPRQAWRPRPLPGARRGLPAGRRDADGPRPRRPPVGSAGLSGAGTGRPRGWRPCRCRRPPVAPVRSRCPASPTRPACVPAPARPRARRGRRRRARPPASGPPR